MENTFTVDCGDEVLTSATIYNENLNDVWINLRHETSLSKGHKLQTALWLTPDTARKMGEALIKAADSARKPDASEPPLHGRPDSEEALPF